MFIQTENTPNPNAIKFLPGCEVNTNEPINYFAGSDVKSPLARKLFKISGIEGVFFGFDFITITKSEHIEWEYIKPEILMTIMDHYVSGMPTFEETTPFESPNYDNLSEIEKQIVEIIETRVRPAVAMDGGDIIYKGFEDGVVKLQLHGSCSGCPSSSVTLKSGIESMLKHYIPEVESVEAVDE